MNRLKRSLLSVALAGAVAFAPAAFVASQSPVMTVYAHGYHGGGHHSGYSTNYYYCNGHAAHTHANGVCPYNTSYDDSGYYYCNGHVAHAHHDGYCPYGNASTSTVKKAQRKLNQCGYSCGTVDGIIGNKTYKAIKKFQRNNGLKVDGVLGAKTLRALGL